MDRLRTELLVQLISPVIWGFGSWLLFLGLNIKGTACLSCFLGISVQLVGSPISIVETVFGAIFFVAGMVLLAISLGVVSAKSSGGAVRWLNWLGRWKPSWLGQETEKVGPDKYRFSLLLLLVATLVETVLVIPGIGETRTFDLSRFYDLWSTVLYFYTTILLLASLILVLYRRSGGYLLSLVVSIIGIGLSVPDILGALPPAAPSFRTSVIFLTNVLFAVPLLFISWKSLRHQVG